MTCPIAFYAVVFIASAGVSAVSVPWWRGWSIRHGLVDDPGHRKIHHTPVPLAGGLAVFTGMALVLLLGIGAIAAKGLPTQVLDKLDYGFEKRAFQLGSVLFGAMGMLLLGWLDDRQELSPARKFAGQFLIAALVSMSGVRVTLFVPSILFSHGITILWILTVTNAFNFTDNMNGLCGGLAILGAGWFGILAAIHEQYLVASLAGLFTGAVAGFLPYNFPKATVFLGDAGSHLVGYWLAVLAILPHFYSYKHPGNPWAVLSPLLVLSVPLLDLASVVWHRTLRGKPFWIGDTNHFSHRLVRLGLSKVQAVLVLWLAGMILGSVSLLIL